MTEKTRKRRNERYADYKLAYAALMLCYPFGVKNLDGEEWRDVEGFDGLYQISNYGRVKSLKENHVKILKPHLHTGGYLRVSLGRKNKFKIHRLVAKTFLDNPLNLSEVDHIYGNKMDNYFKNLEWVTLKENKRRAFRNGLYPLGEEKFEAKLTDEQVRWIRKNYKPYDKKFGQRALSKKFGIHSRTMRDLLNGKTYKSVV